MFPLIPLLYIIVERGLLLGNTRVRKTVGVTLRARQKADKEKSHYLQVFPRVSLLHVGKTRVHDLHASAENPLDVQKGLKSPSVVVEADLTFMLESGQLSNGVEDGLEMRHSQGTAEKDAFLFRSSALTFRT